MVAATVVLCVLPCSLALWAGSKALLPPRTIPRHRDALPILGDAWSAMATVERHHDWQTEQCERMHGQPWLLDLVGRPAGVIVASPALIEDVLQTNADSYGKGEYLGGNLRDLLGDGIFAVDGHKWTRQRKTASNLFSMRELRDSMAVVVQDGVPVLLRLFEKAKASGEPLYLFKLFNRFTLETFTEIAFGIKFGALGSEIEHPFETAFNKAQEQLFARFLLPRWFWKTQRHQPLLATAAAQHQDWRSSLFLDDVSYDGSTPGEEFDPVFLRDVVVNFLIAGRDTTAQALSWFFYCLSEHPHVEQQIRLEMKAKLPELANGAAAMEQINALVYLEAALKETLRLYPSVPANVREALRDVVLCDGTAVKAGEFVGIPSYSLGRMTHVWGPDAKEFKPERWIDSNTGQLITVSPYQFNAFNAGPRMYLGVKLAMMEMKIVAASILSKYQLTAVPGQDVTYALALTLVMKNGFQVTVGERD